MPSESTKTCLLCETPQPIENFGPRSKWCFACRRERHLVRRRETERRYRKGAAYQAWRTTYRPIAVQRHAVWAGRSREKSAAHDAVKRALKSGVLVRKACEVCDNPTTHAHHASYERDQWLNVQWLCPLHHAAAHQ